MTKKELKEVVTNILMDECYDMMDEFNERDICTFVADVLPMKFPVKVERIGASKHFPYAVKISNGRHSFVSMRNEDATGLSESVYYIFEDRLNPTEDEIKTFIEMLNEAWFNLNND